MNVLDYIPVQSQSRPWLKHTVTVPDDKPAACTCERWVNGIKKVQPYTCHHMMIVWADIQNQTKRLDMPIQAIGLGSAVTPGS